MCRFGDNLLYGRDIVVFVHLLIAVVVVVVVSVFLKMFSLFVVVVFVVIYLFRLYFLLFYSMPIHSVRSVSLTRSLSLSHNVCDFIFDSLLSLGLFICMLS